VKSAIWTHQFFDTNERPLIGGVQTYILELAQVLSQMDGNPVIVDSHVRELHGEEIGVQVEGILPADWKAGVAGVTAKRLQLNDPNCIHIVANANIWPKRLGPRTIGIQHGIYWDRPTARASNLSRIAPRAVNLLRSWRSASAVHQFSHLVCVDLAFPTMAACIFSPLPWERMHYIPNFAPEPPETPTPTTNIRRIVFSRRFDPHRGTRIFAAAVVPILRNGWDGEVHIIGNGPDEGLLRAAFVGYDQVHFYCLPFERRMEAFTEDSLVVLPSLSTEGTSLTCIEAMSRGALVMATGVGGLANLVIHKHNGLQVRPLVMDLHDEIKWAVRGGSDVQRMKRNGLETFRDSFTLSAWKERWRNVLEERVLSSGV